MQNEKMKTKKLKLTLDKSGFIGGARHFFIRNKHNSVLNHVLQLVCLQRWFSDSRLRGNDGVVVGGDGF